MRITPIVCVCTVGLGWLGTDSSSPSPPSSSKDHFRAETWVGRVSLVLRELVLSSVPAAPLSVLDAIGLAAEGRAAFCVGLGLTGVCDGLGAGLGVGLAGGLSLGGADASLGVLLVTDVGRLPCLLGPAPRPVTLIPTFLTTFFSIGGLSGEAPKRSSSMDISSSLIELKSDDSLATFLEGLGGGL